MSRYERIMRLKDTIQCKMEHHVQFYGSPDYNHQYFNRLVSRYQRLHRMQTSI